MESGLCLASSALDSVLLLTAVLVLELFFVFPDSESTNDVVKLSEVELTAGIVTSFRTALFTPAAPAVNFGISTDMVLEGVGVGDDVELVEVLLAVVADDDVVAVLFCSSVKYSILPFFLWIIRA